MLIATIQNFELPGVISLTAENIKFAITNETSVS